MNKVVINNCYGGFSLSMKALQLLYKKKGEEYNYPYNYNFVDEKFYKCPLEEAEWLFKEDMGNVIDKETFNNNNSQICCYDLNCPRHDKDLVEVVEELGPDAGGECAYLKVAEISGNSYRICEYDGNEWVETPDLIDWIKIAD